MDDAGKSLRSDIALADAGVAVFPRTQRVEGVVDVDGFQLFQSNHEGDLVDKIQSAYGVFDGIVMWLDDHMILTMHLTMGVSIVIYAAMAVAFWFVTQSIMTKKLNLE